MSKIIYKYKLKVEDVQKIELPKDYQILYVDMQDGQPHMWVLIDANKPLEEVEFHTLGTGYSMKYYIEREYVGTYQMHGGSLVLHVFKVV